MTVISVVADIIIECSKKNEFSDSFFLLIVESSVLFFLVFHNYLCRQKKIVMAMRIDEVQLQIEVKPNYDAQQLNKFKEDLSQANDRLKELEDSRKAIERAKPKKGDAAAWAEYEKRLESVNQDIKAQREVVEKASKAVDQQKQKMGLNALTLRELQNELRRYNTILNNLQPGTKQFNETKQHISDLKGRIAELRKTTNVMIEDTRGSLMKFSENWNHIGFAITNAFNVAEKISGVVGRVRSLLDPMAEMAMAAEGVELAFGRLNKPDMLDQLREATHGTVSDLELMKQAVKFKVFDLLCQSGRMRVEELTVEPEYNLYGGYNGWSVGFRLPDGKGVGI